ncbi:unnamed protein product [Rhizoctonia solani]|uniref:Uncharacterized protein n=1 Tax=Rhizoctonia solani TaxID=456999 RepID=A0A8H3BD16_9AGAM|nr:unnamed protein product [Rhizoctonia solani]
MDRNIPTSSKLPPGIPPCTPEQWYWAEKYMCLSKGRPPGDRAPVRRGNLSCPVGWYWKGSNCIPSWPSSLRIIIPRGFMWDQEQLVCRLKSAIPTSNTVSLTASVPSSSGQSSVRCPPNHWYWQEKQICLPDEGSNTVPPVNLGIKCPTGWHWYKNTHCAPNRPSDIGAPCPDGHKWDNDAFVCWPI